MVAKESKTTANSGVNFELIGRKSRDLPHHMAFSKQIKQITCLCVLSVSEMLKNDFKKWATKLVACLFTTDCV